MNTLFGIGYGNNPEVARIRATKNLDNQINKRRNDRMVRIEEKLDKIIDMLNGVDTTKRNDLKKLNKNELIDLLLEKDDENE